MKIHECMVHGSFFYSHFIGNVVIISGLCLSHRRLHSLLSMDKSETFGSLPGG
jgi:hypothetical protein